MELFDLRGRVAIVTGGNGGIGRGIALALARAGADVSIAARDQAKTAGVVAEIEALGRRSVGVSCDVLKSGDIESAVTRTMETLGAPTILVNNSGIARGGRAELHTDDEWDAVMDTNLKASFQFARAMFPHMRDAGGGKVINIGSEYSLFGSPNVVSYSASKGGVVQLTKSLAVGWAEHNIQVNCIIPGWIRTDMTARGAANPEFSARIVSRTPAGRWGEAEELGGTAVFLASHASDFVTGVSIPVDGGFAVS